MAADSGKPSAELEKQLLRMLGSSMLSVPTKVDIRKELVSLYEAIDPNRNFLGKLFTTIGTLGFGGIWWAVDGIKFNGVKPKWNFLS